MTSRAGWAFIIVLSFPCCNSMMRQDDESDVS